jgi:hypothetical protein
MRRKVKTKKVLKKFKKAIDDGAKTFQDIYATLTPREAKSLIVTATTDKELSEEDKENLSTMVLLTMTAEGGTDITFDKKYEEQLVKDFKFKLLLLDLVAMGIIKLVEQDKVTLLGHDEMLEVDDVEVLENLAKELNLN